MFKLQKISASNWSGVSLLAADVPDISNDVSPMLPMLWLRGSLVDDGGVLGGELPGGGDGGGGAAPEPLGFLCCLLGWAFIAWMVQSGSSCLLPGLGKIKSLK